MFGRPPFDADGEDSALSRGLRQHRQVLIYETAHLKKRGCALNIHYFVDGW
jgi:hypothetical protein